MMILPKLAAAGVTLGIWFCINNGKFWIKMMDLEMIALNDGFKMILNLKWWILY